MNAGPLVEVEDLVVGYPGARRRWIEAVRGVDLSIPVGSTLGLVGESGSGKSSLGGAILGLVPVAGGRVRLAGQDLVRARPAMRRRLSARLQAVFQDPHASLDPARRIGESVGEGLRHALGLPPAEVRRRVIDVLAEVGLPASAADCFPADFSGGQRQRIAIARAIAVDPDFVVCDEAVSALDLSVQAQVLNLLLRLQADRGLSYLFISHDLSVVRHMSDEIAVMYAGLIVERGPASVVSASPAHPYTRALVAAVPVPDQAEQGHRRAARRAAVVAGMDEAARSGCPYAARCPSVTDRCRSERPVLAVRRSGVAVACHLDLDTPAEAGPRPAGRSLGARP